MLRLTALILLFIGGLQGYGQDRKGYYQAEIGGGVTADRLPFWLHTNTFGKITNDTYLWGTVGVGTPFSKSDTRAFDYSFGFEGTGALGLLPTETCCIRPIPGVCQVLISIHRILSKFPG